jgi:hypothetical protein
MVLLIRFRDVQQAAPRPRSAPVQPRQIKKRGTALDAPRSDHQADVLPEGGHLLQEYPGGGAAETESDDEVGRTID